MMPQETCIKSLPAPATRFTSITFRNCRFDGAYQVASYIYTVYARQYANALVLYKPMSEWHYSPGITAASATIASAGSGYTNDDIVTVQGVGHV